MEQENSRAADPEVGAEAELELANIDVSNLSRDELIAHNLRVVEAHFHNENPDDVDKAIALYGADIVWEAPFRGQIYTDPAKVKKAYLDIFQTLSFNRTYALRRFATEDYVFDDQIADVTVIGEGMPNLGFKPGDRISMRLVHCFEMKDGRIAREIAYEMSRSYDGPLALDDIPPNAVVTDYPDGPHFGHWRNT